MARIFIDGFESGDFGLWTVRPHSSRTEVQSTVKWAHDYAAKFAYNQTYAQLTLPSTLSTIYFQFRFYSTSGKPSTSDSLIFGVLNDSTTQACLRVNHTTGYFEACKGTGTVQATGTATMSAATWYLIEGKITINSSSGVFQVKINGSTPMDIDFSGDTQGGADTNITRVGIGDWVGSNTNGWLYAYYDDFILDDAAMPGGTQVIGVGVAGRSLNEDWTPTSGFNYSCVDEFSVSDADYVKATAVDKLDLYPVLPAPQKGSSITCVQLSAGQWKTGSPSAANLKLAVKTHDTEYLSSALTPTATKNNLRYLLTQNPNTSAAWTAGEVRDMLIGIKSSS